MSLELKSSSKSFGGEQRIYAHASAETKTAMRFGLYLPPGEGPFPALFWLSGLTCTEENFIAKAGAQRLAAALGLVIVAPDTSPRGPDVPDDPDGAYDFGLGAGFYVDAAEAPWSAHYRMRSYVEKELYALVLSEFPVAEGRVGIFGHSMGGHGALTMALRDPARFRSVSAFAPIASPMNCPWGRKALAGYLGADESRWREYDACALIEDGARVADMLVDQGTADPFLEEQLKPALLVKACAAAGQPLALRRQEGYDHSYYFIASFVDDHLRWHHERLTA
ncbi:S-formylglutathione hydrolase [Amphiplicatus metriothermophilus]|uniref:S-formylglutathione hydrolase n=1 Tax=Amphiplicatus metriothermophilus TaxID=1519374 RepID=A0A239PWV8_9PROT|nr:S-formylglutathione hydrolase [Amphiplicatus metriothermophilus]MBB5519906.1 S-formylglutathione hydrolase [Amphiplicatus metriothermophilus]SNT74809.1 S-formylglutathione hydrolase [Amphiplicatus metriothermophilus]